MKVLKTLKKIAAVSVGLGMLGATLTGAMALDLKDYPQPFVDANGVYDDTNAFVYGADASGVDTAAIGYITANLQFMAKTAVTSDSTETTVTGGIDKNIPFGQSISNASYIDQELEDDDIDSLFDGSISFQGKEYDTKEVIYLPRTNGIYPATSLISADDNYKSDVYLEVPTEDILQYAYVFDETINISTASTSDPLTVDFLGKQLKITSVSTATASKGTQITASIGDEYYLTMGDSVEVEGKTVTLDNVGSSSVVVTVDGTVKSINSGVALTVNGIEIYVDSVISRTEASESAAILVMGTDARDTYNSGDAYPGEDTNNPNWVWKLAGLADQGTTSITAQTPLLLAVRNRFTATTSTDTLAVGVGDCINLPDNYISVCLDSLTASDSDYTEYKIEYLDSVSFNDAGMGTTTLPTIKFSTTVNEGLVLTVSTYASSSQNTTWAQLNGSRSSDLKTDAVWLANWTTGILPNTTGLLAVVYENTNNQKRLAGWINATAGATRFLEVNYGDTKSDNVVFSTDQISGAAAGSINITMNVTGKTTTDLQATCDSLIMRWKTTSATDTKPVSLGGTTINEAGELYYAPREGISCTTGTGDDISTKDEDHRGKYGIIIKDPKSNGGGNKVLLSIPNEQVFAKVIVKGESTTISSGTTTYVPTQISPSIKKHTDIEDSYADYNLILVGGPCADPLVETVFGLTCDGWAYSEGEALVKLAENGDKVALLISGTTGDDTTRAAVALANYEDYGFEDTEALVKGTSLTDITVEKVTETAEETTTETA
ncbi:hypothetical protein HZB88_02885 [archaeon]|nr:hypothetical protein [archaeon]